MSRERCGVFLSWLLLLVPVAAAAQQPPAAPPHATVQGAVRTVDPRTHTLEVTTGVGMALRVVRLTLAAETRITAGGAPLAAALLRPGDLVRVAYGARPGGFVAYTIERRGTMATGPDGRGGP